MATYAPFIRKLVTAYFSDRKQEKDNFQHMREVMEEIPIEDRHNIAALLDEMELAVRLTACQHMEVISPDDTHQVCKVCGYKRHAFWNGYDTDDTPPQKIWSPWR